MPDTHYAKDVLPLMRTVCAPLATQRGHAGLSRQKGGRTNDPVTELDIATEQHMMKLLADAFPSIAFVGEETGGDRSVDTFWIMDPIDGTEQFIRGENGCTSMIAVVDKGTVQFSAIYDFVGDVMYWAERNLGSYQDDQRLFVNDRDIAEAYICYETRVEPANRQLLESLALRAKRLVPWRTAGWELIQVARGDLDARVTFDPYGKDYDFAPGSLLVEEAGGVVANIGLRSYDYRNTNFIAASPSVFRSLTDERSGLFPTHG